MKKILFTVLSGCWLAVPAIGQVSNFALGMGPYASVGIETLAGPKAGLGLGVAGMLETLSPSGPTLQAAQVALGADIGLYAHQASILYCYTVVSRYVSIRPACVTVAVGESNTPSKDRHTSVSFGTAALGGILDLGLVNYHGTSQFFGMKLGLRYIFSGGGL